MPAVLTEEDLLNIETEASEWAKDVTDPLIYLQSIYRFIATRCIHTVGLDLEYTGRPMTSLVTAFTRWFDNQSVAKSYPIEIPLLAGAIGRAMRYSLDHPREPDIIEKSVASGKSFIPREDLVHSGFHEALEIGSKAALAVAKGYSL